MDRERIESTGKDAKYSRCLEHRRELNGLEVAPYLISRSFGFQAGGTI